MKKRQTTFTLKKRPLTPSSRHSILLNYSALLTKIKPLKFLTKGLKKKGGRNSFGRITCFRIGGGHKQKYRLTSHRSLIKLIPFGMVHSVEYDPIRTSFIYCALFKHAGIFQYVLASDNVKKGCVISSNHGLRRPQDGSPCVLLFNQIGDIIYNINLRVGPQKFIISSSAGTFCKLIKKNLKFFFAVLKIPSGKKYSVSLSSVSFRGKVSNSENRYIVLGKAGRNRWLGKRPSVRGVAMNPVDHPHGGGEGKSSGGRPSVTPWGFLTKGLKNKKKKTNKYIQK